MERVRLMDCGDGIRRALFGGYGTVKAKTASYTVKELEPDGCLAFSNRGATGAVTFTLPKPTKGRLAVFLKVAQQNLLIKGTNGAKVGASNADKILQNTAAEAAVSVTLLADGTDWLVTGSVGTWAANNA